MTDSASNSWSNSILVGSGLGTETKAYYIISPTTSSSHTFTWTAGSVFANVKVAAFKDTFGTPSLDASTATHCNTFSNTVLPGSITPSVNNSVVLRFIRLERATAPAPLYTVRLIDNDRPERGSGWRG